MEILVYVHLFEKRVDIWTCFPFLCYCQLILSSSLILEYLWVLHEPLTFSFTYCTIIMVQVAQVMSRSTRILWMQAMLLGLQFCLRDWSVDSVSCHCVISIESCESRLDSLFCWEWKFFLYVIGHHIFLCDNIPQNYAIKLQLQFIYHHHGHAILLD